MDVKYTDLQISFRLPLLMVQMSIKSNTTKQLKKFINQLNVKVKIKYIFEYVFEMNT